MNFKRWEGCALFFLALLGSQPSFAGFNGSSWHVFPVPIFKTLPGEGQTYGLMPVLTSTGPDNELRSINALAETYNQVTGPSTFTANYIYPTPTSYFYFFGELAQHFAREATFRYVDRPRLNGKFVWEGEFSYLQYPFERFYGFGPRTTSGSETNFVSEAFTGHGEIGYHFTNALTASYIFRVDNWRLHPHAISSIPDTVTIFAGNPEVVPSTNLTHRWEFQYDTHPTFSFSERGELFRAAYLASFKGVGSDFTFHGYNLYSKITRSYLGDRFTTVVRGQLEQRFGSVIPFYLQSALGGASTLRAFVERRFTARHRFSVDVEERIVVLRSNILGTDVIMSLDPFFSVGQVFDQFSEISGRNLQPVAGFGIRMKARPEVVGRLDLGVGREGVDVYATIDYPF